MIEHPLRFQPIFQHYLWGGTRLAGLLGKDCGHRPTAESWELVDHRDGQSRVLGGPWSGLSLRELLIQSGEQILGEGDWRKINAPGLPAALQGRFPLLFKFLDSQLDLSVQVHPDDRQGSRLNPPDRGKTEAWYVMHAEADAKIFAGLRPGVDRQRLLAALGANQLETVLHSFTPQVGDLIFIPAGTVHALGAGLVVAEIQQSSNTTFRLYDWNRVDVDGNPRPLHVSQSLEVINFQQGPVEPIRPSRLATNPHSDDPGSLPSLNCDRFVIRLRQLDQASRIGGDGKLRLLVNVAGELQLERDPLGESLKYAQTILIPANLPSLQLQPLTPTARFLEIYLP